MSKKGKVLEVCISTRKGVPKTPVAEGRLVVEHGLEGDAHAGTGRQVSLLCQESIQKVRDMGLEIRPGDFAENLTVAGLSAGDFRPGVRIRIHGPAADEDALLEVTQIGKECHSDCVIRQKIGDCVMPREGVFARVVRGGVVRAGSVVELLHED